MNENMEEKIKGRFGSLYRNAMVFKTETGPFYVVFIDDEKIQWDLYCNQGIIRPIFNDTTVDIECQGNHYKFICNKVSRENYVFETIRIVDSLLDNKKTLNS